MGLFNATSSIMKINKLLKDLENQITITQSLIKRDASASMLNNSLNVLKSIHQQLIDTFSQSSAARIAMFSIFGNKMQMDAILRYSKDIIYNLYAIIQNK